MKHREVPANLTKRITVESMVVRHSDIGNRTPEAIENSHQTIALSRIMMTKMNIVVGLTPWKTSLSP